MSIFNRTLGMAAVLLLGAQVQADPIQDLSFDVYKAGWYPNFFAQQGPMDCRKTCEVWVGAPREHEQSNDLDPNTKETSVCKVTLDRSIIVEPRNEPKSHWLYGNQFDDRPVCIIVNSAGNAKKSEYFMCECALGRETKQ